MLQGDVESGIRTYRDLAVWQVGMDLVEQIYRATRDWPRQETYRLIDQVCRAAISTVRSQSL